MATNSAATQEFVPIKEVRDGVVVLKDQSLRGILMSSSLNFALKSEESQKSIIYQFQTFLNSLDFSVQIFVQSRRLDIRPYLALLEERYKDQRGELFKLQTREYIEFIKTFTDNASIMTKSFFVVIPFISAVINPRKGIAGAIFGGGKKAEEKAVADTEDKLEEAKSQLTQRMSVVEQGLTRCGIRVVPLGTEEIVELFYRIFNPGDTEKPIQLR